MADWRQIQARIRKARVGADAPTKLTMLFDKTRDGMVAYELASVLEKAGQTDEAVRWYSTAAERFRRAEWRKKAEEALTRLGAPLPDAPQIAPAEVPGPEPEGAPGEESAEAPAAPAQASLPLETAAVPVEGPAAETGERKRRRRGRRGGRHRGKGRREPAAAPAPPVAPVERPPRREPEAPRRAPEPRRPAPPPPAAEPEETGPIRTSIPESSRPGDFAFASRIVRLEGQLRRLMASSLYDLDDVERAPAGPGVFLLSDSDEVTHYYVEACQTLRIALGNLSRGRGGSREASFSLKGQLAEHLGISEARVKDYLKKHCTVRWIQLDEGASHLAHFAIAVLKPVLNE